MKCGGEPSLDAEEVTKREQKLGSKNRSLVSYDGVWETVMLYNYVYDYFRLSRSVDGDFDWLIMHHLS